MSALRSRQGQGGRHHRLIAPTACRARHSPNCLPCNQIYETGVAKPAVPPHVVHCSLGRGYEIAAGYRAQGYRDNRRVPASTTSTLDEENDVRPARWKGEDQPADPPARRGGKALAPCGRAGNVTLVSTDHVSWSEQRKTNPDMLANCVRRAGARSHAAALRQGCALERGIPLTWAARTDDAENPARHFRHRSREGCA